MKHDSSSAQRRLEEEEERRRLLASLAEEQAKHRRLMAEAAQAMAAAKQAYDHLAWVVSEIKREHQIDFHQRMRTAVETMHRCGSRHVTTYAVRKVAGGKTVWEGNVEEFQFVGHRRAAGCYAWYYQEWGRPQSFSVLKRPPIYSPQSAVQLALTARQLPPVDAF